jgi:hypothetical protein
MRGILPEDGRIENEGSLVSYGVPSPEFQPIVLVMSLVMRM